VPEDRRRFRLRPVNKIPLFEDEVRDKKKGVKQNGKSKTG
jgi:hypothetical protein